MTLTNKTSFTILLLITFCLMTNITSAQNGPIVNLRDNFVVKSITEAYDSIIAVQMHEQNIPALSIALVDQKGTAWVKSYGFIDTEKKIRNTKETLFSIQSVSKTFTATAILLAVEEGLLDLNAPIQKYIPDFIINSLHDSEPLKIITLKHLLSHTAGFSHEAPLGNNFSSDSPSFQDHVLSIQETYLRYPIGQRYCYSNLGIDLAAYILQVVTDKPFHRFLSEKIFIPLEMNNTSASPEYIIGNSNRAPGHNRGRKESRVIVPMQGAGGIYTCIEDFAKFVQFHLNHGKVDGKELISSSLLDEMYKIPYPINGQTSGYALGIDTYKKYNSLFLNHGGGGYGYLADMAWYNELEIGAVVLTNSTNHNLQGKLIHEMFDEIIISQLGEKESDEPELHEFVTGEKEMQNLCGNYLGRFGSMNVEIQEGIFGEMVGDNFVPLTFYSENEVFLQQEGYKDYFRFVLNDNGTPNYIVKLNGGLTWDYNDGPNDKPGPNSSQFDSLLGEYGVYIGGNPIAKAMIEKKNGYLYISYLNNSDKLTEIGQEGVYSNCKGELLIFSQNIIFASIFELRKI